MKAAVAPSPRSRLRGSALASVAATASQTLIGLLLYGYLIRSLGAEAVGVWVALMAVGLLACMADLGLNHVLIRSLALPQPAEQAQRILQTLLWAVLLFSGAALLLVYAASALWAPRLALALRLQQDAVQWLPFVLGGLWLNRIADALAGALDGCQRFVPRSAAAVASQLAGLLLTLAAVPHWRMEGAAAAFVVQNALLLLANLVLLARCMPGLGWLRPSLSPAILRASVRYGLSIQALVLCYLVLESAIKLALARGGNLSAVSYFDLSFRIAKGVRGLLASAVRVLVPRLAPLGSAGDAAQRTGAYAASFEILLVVALSVFSLLLAGAPLIARTLLGHHDEAFVTALFFALLPWLIYSLTDPALNLALASGRMRWPLRAHLLTLLVALPPTFVGAEHSFTGWYALAAIAIIIGCGTTLAGIHHEEQMPWRLLHPRRSAAALAGCLVVALLSWQLSQRGAAAYDWLAIAAAELLFLCLLWQQHPLARRLLAPGRAPGPAAPER